MGVKKSRGGTKLKDLPYWSVSDRSDEAIERQLTLSVKRTKGAWMQADLETMKLANVKACWRTG